MIKTYSEWKGINEQFEDDFMNDLLGNSNNITIRSVLDWANQLYDVKHDISIEYRNVEEDVDMLEKHMQDKPDSGVTIEIVPSSNKELTGFSIQFRNGELVDINVGFYTESLAWEEGIALDPKSFPKTIDELDGIFIEMLEYQDYPQEEDDMMEGKPEWDIRYSIYNRE